jgi:hypothetical protein
VVENCGGNGVVVEIVEEDSKGCGAREVGGEVFIMGGGNLHPCKTCMVRRWMRFVALVGNIEGLVDYLWGYFH